MAAKSTSNPKNESVSLNEMNEDVWRKLVFSFITKVETKMDESSAESKQFQDTLRDMQKTLDFVSGQAKTALDNVKSMNKKMGDLQTELNNTKDENEKLMMKINRVEDRCIKLEGYSRRNNLLIDGLAESKDENCEKVVKDFFRDVMKVSNTNDLKMVRVHRIPGGETRGPNLKPRTMITRFEFYQDRELIWNQKKLLKGMPYFLDEDFPEEVRSARKILMPVMMEARRVGKRANLNVDKLYIDGTPYSTQTLKNLPDTHWLNPKRIATPEINDDIVAFFSSASPLSNHHPCEFVIDGTSFHSSEQYYLAEKARFAGDQMTFKQILEAKTAGQCKYESKKIKGDLSRWLQDGEAVKVMKTSLLAKFRQNMDLKAFLLATKNKTLVEANPNDQVWGVGLAMKDRQKLADIANWPGKNGLGKTLEEIRHVISTD